jgi:2'-5' RNA ligase
MEKTVVYHDAGRQATGYMVNTRPDPEHRRQLARLQKRLTRTLGDSLWVTPPETLHITLMDWLAPLVEYRHDKDVLFKELFKTYDHALVDILKNQKPIRVLFDTLKVTPGAVILVGRDEGEFQHIRDQFLRTVSLLPGTKQPPAIIHSTVARFLREQPLQPIIGTIGREELSFVQYVTSFRLVRETVIPQLEHELIKKYRLSS